MNKNELPKYDGEQCLFTECPVSNHYAYRAVSYELPRTKGRLRVGWITDEVKSRILQLERKGERLSREGYKFRNGPVPGISRYSNLASATRTNGLKREYCQNNDCEYEYPEYNLVRSKRKAIPVAAMDWDFFDHHSDGQRCWKRSKKRKQYL